MVNSSNVSLDKNHQVITTKTWLLLSTKPVITIRIENNPDPRFSSIMKLQVAALEKSSYFIELTKYTPVCSSYHFEFQGFLFMGVHLEKEHALFMKNDKTVYLGAWAGFAGKKYDKRPKTPARSINCLHYKETYMLHDSSDAYINLYNDGEYDNRSHIEILFIHSMYVKTKPCSTCEIVTSPDEM